jgi:hypothetical protein
MSLTVHISDLAQALDTTALTGNLAPEVSGI